MQTTILNLSISGLLQDKFRKSGTTGKMKSIKIDKYLMKHYEVGLGLQPQEVSARVIPGIPGNFTSRNPGILNVLNIDVKREESYKKTIRNMLRIRK